MGRRIGGASMFRQAQQPYVAKSVAAQQPLCVAVGLCCKTINVFGQAEARLFSNHAFE